MKETEDRKLREIVEGIIATQNGAITISPSWVATQAMLQLDPKSKSQVSIHLAAHLQFRQIARQALGKKYEPEDDTDKAQHPMWPDLQQRYPLPPQRGEEPRYKLLEYLDHGELLFNIARLRKEANAKLEHADALKAYDAGRHAQRPAQPAAPIAPV